MPVSYGENGRWWTDGEVIVAIIVSLIIGAIAALMYVEVINLGKL